jgi:hypothetical protein
MGGNLASAYKLTNLLTGTIILAVFLYSAFFSANGNQYLLGCAHVQFYGMECPTCGLSQSFSEMIRGNFISAHGYNSNGPLLFGFFSLQLLLRALAGLIIFMLENNSGQVMAGRKVKIVAVSDSVVSLVLLLLVIGAFR